MKAFLLNSQMISVLLKVSAMAVERTFNVVYNLSNSYCCKKKHQSPFHCLLDLPLNISLETVSNERLITYQTSIYENFSSYFSDESSRAFFGNLLFSITFQFLLFSTAIFPVLCWNLCEANVKLHFVQPRENLCWLDGNNWLKKFFESKSILFFKWEMFHSVV